ncbi:hypothetical protein L1857_34605 [Amycolatopsis thermalba]|uniref:Ribbon-helix-helix protein CopG domain-containing protein n=1 Tax=Amycolatopsis thermalba TaxID=944492 RepID=A0ABY4P587_9PSEU|nr:MULTISPECIES: hypothetical protein [Amycolatopsis]UQS27566.1 hypothetical protein L1857_34605 [Amycolatopsis thermalba]
MGARGKVPEYQKTIPLRLSRSTNARLRIFAELDGVPVSSLIRTFIREGLERRTVPEDPFGKTIKHALETVSQLDPRLLKSRDAPSARLRAVVEEYKKQIAEEIMKGDSDATPGVKRRRA